MQALSELYNSSYSLTNVPETSNYGL